MPPRPPAIFQLIDLSSRSRRREDATRHSDTILATWEHHRTVYEPAHRPIARWEYHGAAAAPVRTSVHCVCRSRACSVVRRPQFLNPVRLDLRDAPTIDQISRYQLGRLDLRMAHYAARMQHHPAVPRLPRSASSPPSPISMHLAVDRCRSPPLRLRRHRRRIYRPSPD